jgi:hypothetical protein
MSPTTVPCALDQNWLGWYGSKPTGVACGKPAVSALTLGCFCEHVDTVRICAGCGADVQSAGAARQITCKRCWGDRPEGPGHACWMRATIDWDSGGQTLVQTPDRSEKFDFSGGAHA